MTNAVAAVLVLAAGLNNLAVEHRREGRLAEAERLYRAAALQAESSSGGGESAELARILCNLAELHTARGALLAAAPLFERALRIQERVHGKDDPQTAVTLMHRAHHLHLTGDDAAAMRHYRRALAAFERTFGPHDARVASVLHGMAVVHAWNNEAGEAERLLRRALAIRERTLPAGDAAIAIERHSLERVHQFMRRQAALRAHGTHGLR